MSPPHAFSVLWFAYSTAAVFHGRGSVNDTGKIHPSSIREASYGVFAPANQAKKPSPPTDNEFVSVSETGFAQPTGAKSVGSPHPIDTLHIIQSDQNVTLNSTSLDSDPQRNGMLLEPTPISDPTCTINVPSASIDYWHPATYSHVVGTMTSAYGTFSETGFYTLVAATSTFNIDNALASSFACTFSESPLPDLSGTNTFCLDYSEQPAAATTSLVYRTAAIPFPSGGIIPTGEAKLYDVYRDLPAATHPISVAPDRTLAQVSATPFVHFTAYEVESGNKTEIDVQSHDQISRNDCDAGLLQAIVTVFWNPFFNHVESTVLGFDDPPVNVNHQDDWTLPGDPAKLTPATTFNPTDRPTAIPTTQAGTNNNQQGAAGNEAQPSNAPQPSEVTIGTVAGMPVAIGPSSVVVVGSHTLQPGGPAVIVGGVTPVSLVTSATAIVVGGSTTLPLPQISNDPAPPPILTIGSATLTPNAATQFFIAPGQTLTPGGTATVDGTVVSLAPSAAFFIVGGSTQFLPAAAPSSGAVAASPPRIIIGSTTITALPNQNNPGNTNTNNNINVAAGPTFVVAGQTLAPGGQAITVAGTTLSLVAGESSVVVNGVTSAVEYPSITSSQPRIVVGKSVFTLVPGPGTTFVIADQTLSPGGQAITVAGTVISLAPSASFVVVNGVTSAFPNVVAAQITGAPALTIGNNVFQPLQGTGRSYLVGSSTLTPGGAITFHLPRHPARHNQCTSTHRWLKYVHCCIWYDIRCQRKHSHPWRYYRRRWHHH
ncbi:hypothetical protein BDU57DRAFT_555471 [Ampelomyces quisqualis]|uniref:Uncharacterized protein n=1 Tax=Ampelomyces quisqualis TaxID=50730 RepID=A0A6A5QSY9_AMPQU|nr:hypothetical protein BDU57DRAFT_555471 [Ampelomyces quisqualis]